MKNAVSNALSQEKLDHIDQQIILYFNRFSSIFPVLWMSQQAIADYIGVARETINRRISKLTKLGFLSKQYRGMYRTCIYILFPSYETLLSVFDHTIKIREEPYKGKNGINKRRKHKHRSLSARLFDNISILMHIGETFVSDNAPEVLNL